MAKPKSMKLQVSHEKPTEEDGLCVCGHPRHDHKQGANRCCENGCTCTRYED